MFIRAAVLFGLVFLKLREARRKEAFHTIAHCYRFYIVIK